MSLNQHKILRVFNLIEFLLDGHAKSTRLLQKSLNVSNRSIYRYFDLLIEIGFEIKKDEYGKFYIDKETLPGFYRNINGDLNQIIHEQ
jgi:predicted DNA-binding transcriptional regulator YafY